MCVRVGSGCGLLHLCIRVCRYLEDLLNNPCKLEELQAAGRKEAEEAAHRREEEEAELGVGYVLF